MKHHFVWLVLFLSIGTGARADGLGCFSDPILGALILTEDVLELLPVGDLVYASTNAQALLVLDLSDPSDPVLVERVPVGGSITSISTDGGYLFLTTNANGVHVFDIESPRLPRLVSVADPGGRYKSAEPRGDYLYCAGTHQLIILDIADLDDPKVVGRQSFTGIGHSIALFQNFAVVSTWGWGATIYDVTDPSQPSFVRSISTGGDLKDVIFVEDVMYLVGRLAGLRAYRILETGVATLLDIFSFDDFYPLGMRVHDGVAFVAGSSQGTLLFDVTNPADIRYLMSYRHPGVSWQADLFGDRLIVASGSGGVQVIDHLGGATPILSDLGTGQFVSDLVAGGNDVYVSHTSSLYAYDLSDPANPVYSDGMHLHSHINGLTEDSGTVYLVTDDRELVVVNASDPTALNRVASLILWFEAYDIDIDGDLAVAAAFDRGLILIDISDSSQPALIRRFAAPGITRTVAAEGGIAFLGVDQRIDVVDVRVPNAPTLIERYDVGFLVDDVEVRNGIVVAATGYGGARVFRFDGSLELINVLGFAGDVGDVLIDGERLFVSDRTAGLSMFDIADPAAPRSAGSFGNLEVGGQVAATASAVVFRDVGQRMWVLDRSEICSSCATNVNGDGVLDVADVQAFIALFLAQDPRADWNADGVANIFDIAVFLDEFAMGCDGDG